MSNPTAKAPAKPPAARKKAPARRKKTAPAESPPRDMVDVHRVARELGVTTRTVENFKRESPPIPFEGGGSGRPCRYELEAVLRWYAARSEKKSDKIDLLEAQTRKFDVEARLKELEFQKAEGELLEVEDVRRTLSACFTMLRTELRGLPARYGKSARLSADKRARLREMLDEILERCAGQLESADYLEKDDAA